MSSGIIFIVSAPSGGGKTTLLRRVMADMHGLIFSVSHTTRKPRSGEENGRDYYFISKKLFKTIRDQSPSGFLEWAEVHGNFYGTSCQEVENRLSAGLDVVLDIDVQGARQIQRKRKAVSVFIAPPSLAELESRLRKRNTESEEIVSLRLKNGIKELAAIDEYDYLIINDKIEEAVRSLMSVIVAERCRNRRSSDGKPLAPIV